jgi:hypothetical protein
VASGASFLRVLRCFMAMCAKKQGKYLIILESGQIPPGPPLEKGGDKVSQAGKPVPLAKSAPAPSEFRVSSFQF